ncbi:aldo/keto reductase [Acetilactobacillus jinshanensis]|uniref:Aldo/keto reductase n=1 Tax=Acetilactobacillus jinshanensis TaxID=1720083 RepID=A0A4P6ZM95_9LACO|nr:aldo/keto reductase [Acetilactobacillus jinshanensis]QBP18914.1 aldo/keto reductase [Acetilactobacillus jinshanensis]URL60536.1 aldo/keto reductase [uncultured bacterium]
MQYLKLNDGHRIPANGFGDFQVPDTKECADAVREAIKTGYNFIDTAEMYDNEDQTGKGIKASGIDRDKLFVETKIWETNFQYDDAKNAIDKSLKDLGLNYVNMFLIHWPHGEYDQAWRAMIEAHQAGKLKSIGVSNFSSQQIVDLIKKFGVKPAVNQIKINPWDQKHDEVKWLEDHNIVPEAWSPFAEGRHNAFHDPTLGKIAKAHGKSNSQVILRWLYQRGIVSLAKTVHPQYMKENFDIYSFKLTPSEMKTINNIQ